MTNMADDWIYFNDLKEKCTSEDCIATRNFHNCNMMICGHLVVAWKDHSSYNFIASGSHNRDLTAGFIHFRAAHELATMDTLNFCRTIASAKIQNCYTLKTLSQVGTTCDEYYLQYDSALSINQETYSFSSLDWWSWCMVVSSIVTAIVAAIIAGVSYYRYRKLTLGDENIALIRHKVKNQSILNKPCKNEAKNVWSLVEYKPVYNVHRHCPRNVHGISTWNLETTRSFLRLHRKYSLNTRRNVAVRKSGLQISHAAYIQRIFFVLDNWTIPAVTTTT